MYHISKQYLGEFPILVPLENRTRDDKEPKYPYRICFSPTIMQCLMGVEGSSDCEIEELLEKSVDDEFPKYHVYRVSIGEENKLKRVEPGIVFDSEFTNEHWATENIHVDYYGSILPKKDNLLNLVRANVIYPVFKDGEEQVYSSFDKWFYEIEYFSLRAERAYEEIEHSPNNVLKWLKAAYDVGRESVINAIKKF